MIVIGMMYFVIAVLYIVPSVLLIRFSQRISSLASQPNVHNLEFALEAQKKFWRFVGIMAAVVLLIYVMILVGAVVVGVLAS
jgi:hypothetical protein